MVKWRTTTTKETQKRGYNQLFPPVAICFSQIPLYMYKNIDHKEGLPNQLKMTENVSLIIVSTPLIKNFVRKQTFNELISFDRFEKTERV